MSNLIRVSDVLTLLYPSSLDYVDQEDLDRGTRCHFAMECYVNDLIQGFTPVIRDPAIEPVVEWICSQDVEFISAEECETHKYGYSGRPDVQVIWNGEPCIWDWKFSGGISEQNKMQLTAYSKFGGRRTHFIQCKKDGTVKAIRCRPDSYLWSSFLSGLNVVKFHQSHLPKDVTCQPNSWNSISH